MLEYRTENEIVFDNNASPYQIARFLPGGVVEWAGATPPRTAREVSDKFPGLAPAVLQKILKKGAHARHTYRVFQALESAWKQADKWAASGSDGMIRLSILALMLERNGVGGPRDCGRCLVSYFVGEEERELGQACKADSMLGLGSNPAWVAAIEMALAELLGKLGARSASFAVREGDLCLCIGSDVPMALNLEYPMMGYDALRRVQCVFNSLLERATLDEHLLEVGQSYSDWLGIYEPEEVTVKTTCVHNGLETETEDVFGCVHNAVEYLSSAMVGVDHGEDRASYEIEMSCSKGDVSIKYDRDGRLIAAKTTGPRVVFRAAADDGGDVEPCVTRPEYPEKDLGPDCDD
jgi:hypothetical protein